MLTLRIAASTELRGETALHLAVSNTADEPAEHLEPRATFLGATVRGQPADALPPGFTTTWDLVLPAPPGRGSYPLVVQLHYADGFGRATSAPVVHVVQSPGLSPPAFTVAVEGGPVASGGNGRVRIENPEPVALAGTLGVVTGNDLSARPAERPVEVAARGALEVPLELENRGALPGSTVPIYAYVTLARDGRQETRVASAGIEIADPESPARPAGWMVAATVLLVLAAAAVAGWARMRRTTGPASRAARRRRRGS